jgi:hypothetical protein
MAQNKSITSRYYPSLADLVDKKKVPAFLHNFLFDHYDDSTPPVFIIGALSKIHYRNLQFTKSSNGDSASYNLELVTKKKIDYELPGGVSFVLNGDGTEDVSAYPISPGIYSIIITDQYGLCTLKRALQ